MMTRLPPSPLSRRTFGVGAMLAAASLAAPAVWAQPKLEKNRVAMAVGGKALFHYLPLTVAEQLGFFRDEGLEVEIHDVAGDAHALQAVLGGMADVVSGTYEHTINLQNRGQFFQAFVLQGRAPQVVLGVSMKTMPGFKTVHELKGRRIGVVAQDSSTSMLAHVVLSRYGIRASEVSLIDVGSAAGALGALRSGQIDAISSIDPVMTLLEQKGEVRIIYDTRTLKGTQEVFGGPMPAACLYASQEFLKKHPNTAQAMTNAIVHGLKWLQTAGPRDLIKTVPEAYLVGDRGLYLSSFNKVRESIAVDGMFPEDGGKIALRALASLDATLKTEKIDLARTFTNQFALRAKVKFKA